MAGISGLSSGMSVISASVVRIMAAMLVAFSTGGLLLAGRPALTYGALELGWKSLKRNLNSQEPLCKKGSQISNKRKALQGSRHGQSLMCVLLKA